MKKLFLLFIFLVGCSSVQYIPPYESIVKKDPNCATLYIKKLKKDLQVNGTCIWGDRVIMRIEKTAVPLLLTEKVTIGTEYVNTITGEPCELNELQRMSSLGNRCSYKRIEKDKIIKQMIYKFEIGKSYIISTSENDIIISVKN